MLELCLNVYVIRVKYPGVGVKRRLVLKPNSVAVLRTALLFRATAHPSKGLHHRATDLACTFRDSALSTKHGLPDVSSCIGCQVIRGGGSSEIAECAAKVIDMNASTAPRLSPREKQNIPSEPTSRRATSPT